MALQVPFAPLPFGLFFSVTVTIYLEKLRPTKLIKQNKTKQNKQNWYPIAKIRNPQYAIQNQRL